MTSPRTEALDRVFYIHYLVQFNLILQNFHPECHIRIETDASSYAIKEVLSQLSSNQVISDGAIGSNIA